MANIVNPDQTKTSDMGQQCLPRNFSNYKSYLWKKTCLPAYPIEIVRVRAQQALNFQDSLIKWYCMKMFNLKGCEDYDQTLTELL